jgi:ABC-type Fe3+-citrate transport system substrate-binding protein
MSSETRAEMLEKYQQLNEKLSQQQKNIDWTKVQVKKDDVKVAFGPAMTYEEMMAYCSRNNIPPPSSSSSSGQNRIN